MNVIAMEGNESNTLAPEVRRAVDDFYSACPSFCDTPENWKTLASYLPEEFDCVLHWPTTQELFDAYCAAIADGRFRVN